MNALVARVCAADLAARFPRAQIAAERFTTADGREVYAVRCTVDGSWFLSITTEGWLCRHRNNELRLSTLGRAHVPLAALIQEALCTARAGGWADVLREEPSP